MVLERITLMSMYEYANAVLFSRFIVDSRVLRSLQTSFSNRINILFSKLNYFQTSYFRAGRHSLQFRLMNNFLCVDRFESNSSFCLKVQDDYLNLYLGMRGSYLCATLILSVWAYQNWWLMNIQSRQPILYSHAMFEMYLIGYVLACNSLHHAFQLPVFMSNASTVTAFAFRFVPCSITLVVHRIRRDTCSHTHTPTHTHRHDHKFTERHTYLIRLDESFNIVSTLRFSAMVCQSILIVGMQGRWILHQECTRSIANWTNVLNDKMKKRQNSTFYVDCKKKQKMESLLVLWRQWKYETTNKRGCEAKPWNFI